MKKEVRHKIDSSADLHEAIQQYTEIPDKNTEEGFNKPFINDYKIDITDEGTARFFFNVTTHKLLRRISDNRLGLFQIDPTYKLIWKGHNVQVHGTSNEINEFFPTGVVVASHEDEKNFSDFFRTLLIDLKFLLADGSKAITKAKQSVWPPPQIQNSSQSSRSQVAQQSLGTPRTLQGRETPASSRTKQPQGTSHPSQTKGAPRNNPEPSLVNSRIDPQRLMCNPHMDR